LGVAAILVTHDQEEAFDLADRIGVMSYGRLIEVGTPQDLYQRPQTEFVASFLGTANILLGQTEGEQIQIGPHEFKSCRRSCKVQRMAAYRWFSVQRISPWPQTKPLIWTALHWAKGTVTVWDSTDLRNTSGSNCHPFPACARLRPLFHLGIKTSSSTPAVHPNNPRISTGGQSKSLGWNSAAACLSHPGLNFLVVTDGSLRSQSAVSLGGYLARMAHARMTLLGVGKDHILLDAYLQDARKQIGSGMASVEVQTDRAPPQLQSQIHRGKSG
jgi:sulfate/thiosulfate transport system ATP-binding protein